MSQKQKEETNKKILEKLKHAPSIVQIIKLESRLNNISCIKAIDNKPKYIRYVKETKESYIHFTLYVNRPAYADLLSKQVNRLLADI